MKSYYLHSIAWTQLIAPLLFFPIYIFCVNYNEACECLRFIGDPLYQLTLSIDILYHFSFIGILFYAILFFLASLFVASIIAPIIYFWKKKAPKPTAFWVQNLLWAEIIFIASLFITTLLWLLPHHLNYKIENDNTGGFFIIIALVFFPLFLLGNYLKNRKITMIGNTFLSFSGIVLGYALMVSFCAFRFPQYAPDYAYYEFYIPPTDDEINDEILVISDTETDEDEYPEDEYYNDEEEELFEWDSREFNADSLAKILRDKRYDSLVLPSHFSQYLQAPNKQLKRKHPTLNRLAEIIGRDSQRIEVFWQLFNNQLLRYFFPKKGDSSATAFTIRLYAHYLLEVYHQIENSTPDVYEDILDVMILSKPLQEQLELLKPIFSKYDIPQFAEALAERDPSFVRWAYTFWARRYYENNLPITLSIIGKLAN